MVKGVNGQVSVENGQVIIARKGFFGTMTRNEDVRIPLEKLSYIQLVKPTVKNGFINFVMAGSPQVSTPEQAAKDSSCVIVNSLQYKKFVELKQEIENQMTASQNKKPPSDDITASLERLSDMKDKGVITQSEFEEKKKELLSRI